MHTLSRVHRVFTHGPYHVHSQTFADSLQEKPVLRHAGTIHVCCCVTVQLALYYAEIVHVYMCCCVQISLKAVPGTGRH